MNPPFSAPRRIGTRVLTGLVVVVFLGSGLLKLSGAAPTVAMAQEVGGRATLLALGGLELLLVGLFLLPRTGVVGVLLMVAYMGGAIAVHVVRHQSIGLLVGIEVLIWLAAAARFPELTRRLVGEPKSERG